jgi:hypothetical protein
VVDDLAHYKVYVVRYWEEQDVPSNRRICRFTLEIPATGQRFGFTSPEALMQALEQRLTQGPTSENG